MRKNKQTLEPFYGYFQPQNKLMAHPGMYNEEDSNFGKSVKFFFTGIIVSQCRPCKLLKAVVPKVGGLLRSYCRKINFIFTIFVSLPGICSNYSLLNY